MASLEGTILEGKEFLGEIGKKVDNGKILRRCSNCFYRKYQADCSEKTAKNYFNIKPGDMLPGSVNSHEVGNYCPYFLDKEAD
jgi:translation initiation factor IF-1